VAEKRIMGFQIACDTSFFLRILHGVPIYRKAIVTAVYIRKARGLLSISNHDFVDLGAMDTETLSKP
jgi:hypothetical protein